MYHRISLKDRYVIEKMYSKKYAVSDIAEVIGVSRQAVYQEIKRGLVKQYTTHLVPYYTYSASVAQAHHDFMVSNRGTSLKLSNNYDYAKYVSEKIKLGYSPDVIVGDLRRCGQWSVCTRTLYTYIDRGYIPDIDNSNLHEKLRRKKKKLKEKKSLKNPRYGNSIVLRPDIVNSRSSFGHWEMDLIVSKQSRSCLLTMLERFSRFCIVRKLPNKSTYNVSDVLHGVYSQYGLDNFKSITVDNGSEFAAHELFSKVNGIHCVDIYYCHPYCSCERGSNERLNRQLRRYFPKKTDFNIVSDFDILCVQDKLNNMPRKILHYFTPSHLFNSYKV